jgi:PP-loop superfamily ATP-utilizing enzyme
MQSAWEQRDDINRAIKEAGFHFVAQDLEGYRSGRMNDPLEKVAEG